MILELTTKQAEEKVKERNSCEEELDVLCIRIERLAVALFRAWSGPCSSNKRRQVGAVSRLRWR